MTKTDKVHGIFEAQARVLGMINQLDLSKGEGILIFKLTEEEDAYTVQTGVINLSDNELLQIFCAFTEQLNHKASQMPEAHRLIFAMKVFSHIRANLMDMAKIEVPA